MVCGAYLGESSRCTLETGHRSTCFDQSRKVSRIEERAACHLPPAGWHCLRPAHHAGPCDAHPGHKAGLCPVTMGSSLLPCVLSKGHPGNHKPDSTVPDYIPRPNTWDTHG